MNLLWILVSVTAIFISNGNQLLDDETAPVVSCIDNIRIVTNESLGTTVSWTEPTATDNSGFVNTSRTHTPGSFFDIGNTTVIYTFTDRDNNVASCTFIVNVVLLAAPLPIRFTTSYSYLLDGNPTGRVEIKYLDEWKRIAVSNSLILNSHNIAKVLCRQLGYNNGSSHLTKVTRSYENAEMHDVWFEIKDCIGTEHAIEHCSRYGTGLWSEGLKNYAAVTCDANEPVQFRLVGGTQPSEGRVEANFFGDWGRLCAKLTPGRGRVADVVCRQLGYTNGSSHRVSTDIFEESQINRIWTHIGDCSDNAEGLDECQHSPWVLYIDYYTESCNVGSDFLAVICNSSEPGPLRLVGGSRPSEGRVEIQFPTFDGWGSVCVNLKGSFTDLSDMVCRQLGYDNGISYMVSSDAFDIDIVQPIWLHVAGSCSDGDRLEDCMLRPWGSDFLSCDAPHNDYLAVVCNGEESDIRLIRGSLPSEGVVEINFNGTTWGTICTEVGPSNLKYTDYGERICRQLGYNDGFSYMVSPFVFEVLLTRVMLDIGECHGSENRIQNCQNRPWGNHVFDRYHCDGEERSLVAVVCNDTTGPRPIRLVGSSQPNEGRLEIKLKGTWGRVCAHPNTIDAQWDQSTVDVVCRQLGFPLWSHVAFSGKFGKGSGPIWLTDVHCTGTESHLDSCSHNLWGNNQPSRQYSEGCDVGVVCNVSSPVSIELAGGSVPSEGLLQVYFYGQAGNVCNNTWNDNNTKVVCRQLGFTDGISYLLPSESFGFEGRYRAASKIWLDEVSCNGDEEYLHDCPHLPWGATGQQCNPRENHRVAIVCNGRIPEVRLVGGRNSREGRVEINLRGQWGTVCARGSRWSDTEAGVVCRQLGYTTGWSFATSSAMFGYGTGIIWLEDVKCQGNENALAECSYRPWFSRRECNHEMNDRVGVICEEDRSLGLNPNSVPGYTLQTNTGILED